MPKFSEYPETGSFDTDDILIKDGTNGTKKIKAMNAFISCLVDMSVVNRRNIYRGICIGEEFTTTQLEEIQNGTFNDMFVGDYWTIGEVDWVIADFDYWMKTGDTVCTSHHVVIVPKKVLYTASYGSATAVGYGSSTMRSSTLESAKTTINTAFNSNVLTHRAFLPTTVSTDGYATAGSWFDSTVELLSEVMLFGARLLGNRGTAVPEGLYTADNRQLALFRLDPTAYRSSGEYWLRDYVADSNYAGVTSWGLISSHAKYLSKGVRPVFAIG